MKGVAMLLGNFTGTYIFIVDGDDGERSDVLKFLWELFELLDVPIKRTHDFSFLITAPDGDKVEVECISSDDLLNRGIHSADTLIIIS